MYLPRAEGGVHTPQFDDFLRFFCLFSNQQPSKNSHSEENLSSQAVYSKPPPPTTKNMEGESSPEEVEVLLSNQKAASRQPSFLRALIKAFGPYFLIGSAYKLLQDVITFVNPQLLR